MWAPDRNADLYPLFRCWSWYTTKTILLMRYRRLGTSGLQVSELSLGSWLTFGKQIGDPVAEQLMKVAYDGGDQLLRQCRDLCTWRKRTRDGQGAQEDEMVPG